MASIKKYSKRAILQIDEYKPYVDYLSFTLLDTEVYTLKQIEKLIKTFKERKVI